MTFSPQNVLERSLMKAADDPAHRPQFYKDLTENDLFIIQHGPIPEAHGQVTLQKDHQIRIQNIEANGKSYVPVFTSLPRLQAMLSEEAGYIALNALDLFNIIQGADLLLNPGSDYGKEFTKDEIKSIMDGSIWEPSQSWVAEKDTQVLIGQPSNYPHELVKTLSRLFKKIKEIKKAYLAHIHHPERGEPPHTIIGIEVTGNWEQVVSQAGLVARDLEIPDPPIDINQITGDGGLDEYFINDCKPFYRKKIFGLI
jgi:hypothetical protein